jgi:hypothetical protein
MYTSSKAYGASVTGKKAIQTQPDAAPAHLDEFFRAGINYVHVLPSAT